MNKKMRADNLVVYQGLAENPPKARALIMAGLVFSQQERVEKPGQLLDKERDLILKEKLPFVSRGGLKLAEALEEFNFCVDDKTAADLGASTGGFTDCLLQRGARKVFAVDVDTRQLDWNLRLKHQPQNLFRKHSQTSKQIELLKRFCKSYSFRPIP